MRQKYFIRVDVKGERFTGWAKTISSAKGKATRFLKGMKADLIEVEEASTGKIVYTR